MTSHAGHAVRRAWWKRFHPLVRIGWYVATNGTKRPATQTAMGIGMMAAGVLLRRSHKRTKGPIYVTTLNPGETTRIRVYRGTSAPSEVTVRT